MSAIWELITHPLMVTFVWSWALPLGVGLFMYELHDPGRMGREERRRVRRETRRL